MLRQFGVVAVIAVCIGCGGSGGRPKLGRVSGVVTLDGAPLQNVLVIFVPENERSSTATTDASGKYELQFTAGVRGAALGSNQVRIEGLALPDKDDLSVKLPARYNTKSELTADVKDGDNNFDFELVSDAPGTNPREPAKTRAPRPPPRQGT